MVLKKVVAVQAAYFLVLLLTLYVSVQADYPFLNGIVPAEFHCLLKCGFTILIWTAAWRFLYYVDTGSEFSFRNVLFYLVFLIGLISCFFVLRGFLPFNMFCVVLCVWGGSTLGTLEKNFRDLADLQSFAWIAPLPFCLFIMMIPQKAGWDLLSAGIFLGGICAAVHLFLTVSRYVLSVKLLILLCTICCLCATGIFMIRQEPVKSSSHISEKGKKNKSDSLFPLLILSLLHSENDRQNVLILSTKQSNPEFLKISRSLKMVREIRTAAPREFYKNFSCKKNPSAAEFHVILYDIVPVNSLESAMLYSADFFRTLKKNMAPGGILALDLSGNTPGEKDRYSEITLFRIVKKVFPCTKLLSRGRFLLCSSGEKQLITDPELLEFLADKRGKDREYFPKGVFHILLNTPMSTSFSEEYQKKETRFSEDPIELYLLEKKTNSWLQKGRNILNKILREAPYFTWLITVLGLICLVIYRYFHIAQEKHKKNLSFDNGFFAGGLIVILSVYLPLRWGAMHPFFNDLYFIMLGCGFCCGSFPEKNPHTDPKWRSILFTLMIFSPLFLYWFVFHEEWYNALLFFLGGAGCGFYIKKRSLFCREYFFGIGSGILLGCFSLLLPGIYHFPFLLAAAAAENVKKIFEKN